MRSARLVPILLLPLLSACGFAAPLDEERTAVLRADARANQPPVRVTYGRGELVVQQGEQFSEADVAFRSGEPADDSLFGRKICDSVWAIYASRSYVQQHGRPGSIAELADLVIDITGIGIAVPSAAAALVRMKLRRFMAGLRGGEMWGCVRR